LCTLRTKTKGESLLYCRGDGELLLLYAICNSWYNLVKEVGDATFGNVWRAVNKLTGEVLSCFSREIKSSTLFVFDFRNLMSEIGAFKCLSCMHQRGYFHSDLRPAAHQSYLNILSMNHVYVFFSDAENLLVSKDVIKMTDIGQAERSIRVHHTQCMSRHAGTRNLKYQLESYVYTSKVG
ncbi:hypothetical protein IGI04_009636, partial [Brassica rapa subsp. trilocularis]